MIRAGYATRAHQKNPKSWYLPQHGVYRPKKPGKIKVVFDCSAEFQGHSLNRLLLQGPDLTNSLLEVLCHFCQEPLAFACGIKGMYHQVKVNDGRKSVKTIRHRSHRSHKVRRSASKEVLADTSLSLIRRRWFSQFQPKIAQKVSRISISSMRNFRQNECSESSGAWKVTQFHFASH